MTVQVQVLGPYVAVRDGSAISDAAYGGRLPRRLVRFLATCEGHDATRDGIADALWGRTPPADPAGNVAVLVNRTRRVLGEAAVATTESGYRLGRDVMVDADRFRALVEEGHAAAGAGAAADALASYRAALALWRGQPLESDDGWWAVEAAAAWRRARMQALLGAAAAALALGDPQGGLACAREAIGEDPLHEAAHLLAVRCAAATGDRNGALDLWQGMRRALAEELGIEPSAAAHAVQRAVLGDVSPTPVEAGGADAAVPALGLEAGVPFLGREAELAAAVSAARAGRVVVVFGVAGAGKTRLLTEAARRLGRESVSARARLAESDTDWGVVRHLLSAAISRHPAAVAEVSARALPALADLVPRVGDLRAVEHVVIDERARRFLLCAAVNDVLEALPADIVVTVDDWQWADDSSVEAIGGWLARPRRCAVVVAARRGDPAANPAAMALLDRLPDGTCIDIGALPPPEWDRILDPELRAAIVSATDGTPWQVLDVLRSLEQRGSVVRRSDGCFRPATTTALADARGAAAAGQRARLTARLDQLATPQLGVVAVLAVLERPIPLAALSRCLQRPVDALSNDLQRLADAGLARQTSRGWEPSHDLVGAVIRDVLSATDREAAHAAVARTTDDAADRAAHLAGAGDPDAAAAYLVAALDRAQRAAAAEAERLATAGLALGPAAGVRCGLLAVRSDARAVVGDLPGGRQDLREALALATDAGTKARLLVRQALLHFGADNLHYAGELLALALAAAGENDTARAPALALTAMCEANLGAYERAASLSAEALAIYRRLGDPRGMAEVLDDRAMAVFLEGRIEEAIGAFDRACRLLTDVGDLTRAVLPRATRGHALALAHRPVEGLADADIAIDLAMELGFRDGECFARVIRSYALTSLGRWAEAIAEGEKASALADAIGHRGWSSMAWCNIGVARDLAGDLDAAQAAFVTASTAGRHVPLFYGLAQLGLASMAWQQGRAVEARDLLAVALAGPPLVALEAGRLAARLGITPAGN